MDERGDWTGVALAEGAAEEVWFLDDLKKDMVVVVVDVSLVEWRLIGVVGDDEKEKVGHRLCIYICFSSVPSWPSEGQERKIDSILGSTQLRLYSFVR